MTNLEIIEKNFSEPFIKQLILSFSEQDFSPGQIIFSKDNSNFTQNSIYLIGKGEVQLCT